MSKTPAEREADLQRIIENQRRRIVDLESELDSLKRVASGGVLLLAEARKEDAQRIDELTQALHETAPEISKPHRIASEVEIKAFADKHNVPILKWGEACKIGARIWIRYGANPDQLDVIELDDGIYPGSREQARAELAAVLEADLQRLITPHDVRIYSLDGVTVHELQAIANRLRLYQNDKEQFNAQRLSEFNLVWPQMQNTGRWKQRKGAKDRFYESIEAILNNAGKRRAKIGGSENTSPQFTESN